MKSIFGYSTRAAGASSQDLWYQGINPSSGASTGPLTKVATLAADARLLRPRHAPVPSAEAKVALAADALATAVARLGMRVARTDQQCAIAIIRAGEALLVTTQG